MEFGSKSSPGKQLREIPAIATDRNGSMRLEMARDHPMLVQHSRFHTQDWRANGDISLILSKSPPENTPVNEIIATEKYALQLKNMCQDMLAKVTSQLELMLICLMIW